MDAHDPPSPSRRLHDDALVFDGHADTLLGVLDSGHGMDLAPAGFHIDLPRMALGGLDVEFLTAFVDPSFLPRARARALGLIEALHAQAARFPDGLCIAGSAGEVEEAVARGLRVAVPAIEGGHAIEDDLDNLRDYHRRGVRLMTLTWNNSNNWADGCLPGPDDPHHGGLTDFGRRVVGEMERLGVIVDVSHASPETFWQVEEIAVRPFVASHSCAASLVAIPRNLDDDQLRAIARHGGLVGVCFASAFLVDETVVWRKVMETREYAALPEKSGRLRPFAMPAGEEALYQARVPRATLDDLLDHIDHMVSLMGVEHVGLGSDYDGVTRLPVGLEDVTGLPRVTEGLLSRGYDESAIRAILGGNWLRVLRDVAGG